MFMKSYFSDTASYKKRVDSDCLLPLLRYDKILSKNAMKNQVDKDEKIIQVNEVRNKLIKVVPETTD